MKKQIITTLSILTLIGIASASTTIYSGEKTIIPLEFEIVNCSISNNSHNLNGLNLSWEGKNITISTHPLYQSDKFLITCFVIKEGEIVKQHYSSGGGRSYRKKEDKEINYTDDINKFRKEVLLKQLMEGQNKSQEEVIEDKEEETIKEKIEDFKNKITKLQIITIMSLFIFFLMIIIIYMIWRKNDKKM